MEQPASGGPILSPVGLISTAANNDIRFAASSLLPSPWLFYSDWTAGKHCYVHPNLSGQFTLAEAYMHQKALNALEGK